MAETWKLDPKALVRAGFDRAIEVQHPVAAKNVERLRRVNPDTSPTEMIEHLNKFYLGTVTATGVGAGATAAVPNGWVQIPAAAADLLAFLEASVLYTLTIADVHGIDVEDVERRRLLVMAVLVGNAAATSVLEPVIGRTAPYWGKKIVESIPMSTINAANRVLGPRFITKYGAKQGVLVLGKQVPLLIGAGIGGGGNNIFGRFVIRSGKNILGSAPQSWDKPFSADLREPNAS